MIETSRRKFFIGLAALMAAPAIVRASNLMPVKVVIWQPTLQLGDVITLEGVHTINRVTKKPTNLLRQFVVTAAYQPKSNNDLPELFPRMVSIEQNDKYPTVDVLPGREAFIRLVERAPRDFVEKGMQSFCWDRVDALWKGGVA